VDLQGHSAFPVLRVPLAFRPQKLLKIYCLNSVQTFLKVLEID